VIASYFSNLVYFVVSLYKVTFQKIGRLLSSLGRTKVRGLNNYFKELAVSFALSESLNRFSGYQSY
jgi:hypothetical protein